MILTIVISCFFLASVKGVKGEGQWTPRDSYIQGAEHLTNLKEQDPSAFYYRVQPQTHIQHYGYAQHKTGSDGYGLDYYGNGLDEADPKVDLLSLALGTASSLSWVSTGILAIILLPVILPIIIAPIALILLIIYFIPVVRLDLEPDGSRRKLSRVGEAMRHLEATARLVYHVSANEDCLERVACEVGRKSRLFGIPSYIQKKLSGFKNPLVKRISRALSPRLGSDCQSLKCNPGRVFREILKSFNGKLG